ncbi:hypothetical protein GE09DRAFT_967220, partial [Coniochaeta sp. 2T2.1]
AREFEVPYGRLRNRLAGLKPKKGTPVLNTKLSNAEEKVVCRYIDRFNRINLVVKLEFVVDIANAIL